MNENSLSQQLTEGSVYEDIKHEYKLNDISMKSTVAEREAMRVVRGAIDEVYNDIEYKNKKDALLAECLLKCH